MDEQILAGLESGDPMQQRSALATAGIMLAAVQPDKFNEVYKAANPTEATPATIREYNARVAQFGKAAADAWLRTQDMKLVPVTQGGTVFQVGGDTVPQGNAPAMQGGGDPSGSGAGLLPRSARPAGKTDDQLFQEAREAVEAGASVDAVFRQLREWGVQV